MTSERAGRLGVRRNRRLGSHAGRASRPARPGGSRRFPHGPELVAVSGPYRGLRRRSPYLRTESARRVRGEGSDRQRRQAVSRRDGLELADRLLVSHSATRGGVPVIFCVSRDQKVSPSRFSRSAPRVAQVSHSATQPRPNGIGVVSRSEGANSSFEGGDEGSEAAGGCGRR